MQNRPKSYLWTFRKNGSSTPKNVLILSKYQCGFRKGFNAQHCLVSMIEKWKESVDNGGAFGLL